MAQTITFSVSETSGLPRRFGYPVTASLESARHDRGAEKVRLLAADGKEVSAQFAAMSKWPDGSVRGLDIDFYTEAGAA